MIEFATPLGFWLGLAGAGVLAAHLVRRRARRVVVPFLALWRPALDEQRGGFGAALVRWLDLALVLLACTAVAVAAGGPFLPGKPDTVRDLVLVLDGGLSLRAGQRLDRLTRVAESEVRRRAKGTRFVVVGVRDEGATVWTGDDKAAVVEAVRAHRAGWLVADRSEALALARTAARRLRAPDLVLCTHRGGRVDGMRLRVVAEEVENAGITSLEVVADPEGGGVLARVGLAGSGDVAVGPEGGPDAWSGALDGTRTVVVPLPAGGPATVRLRPRDGFAPDDAVVLALPERVVPRVLVVADGDPSPFLAAALQALEKTGAIAGPLGRTTPARAADAVAAYDVLVFDRCAPPARVPGLRALYLAPPPGALPFRVGGAAPAPALFDVDDGHALLRGLDLGRVAPLRARAIHGGDALASAQPGPVLAAAPAWVALGFDPDRSVLAASPAYPLFLRNCIAHLAERRTTREPEFFVVGEAAPVRGVAQIDGHRGGRRVGARLVGPPGFWRFEGRTLPVNLFAPGLDLRPPRVPSDPLADVGVPGRDDEPLTVPLAAAALLLLLLAWWAFWRTT